MNTFEPMSNDCKKDSHSIIIPYSALPVKCVLYARYSSHTQTEQSIEGQRTVCEEYAQRENLRIIAEYVDRAKSGTSDRRPEFQRMISDIEDGSVQVQAVLVYKLDRFARNRADSAMYKRKLRELGVRVISATEPLTDTPEGIILESVLEGMDEYYSAELSRKMRRGKEESLKKGCYIGSKAPFGYEKSEHRLVINELQAAIVQDIFDKYVSGETLASIARYCAGISSAIKWGKCTISRILHNEIYTGVYRHGTLETVGSVPKIIEPGQFKRAQELLAASAKRSRESRSGYNYFLTGHFWCAQCRRRISGVSNSRGRHYYTCTSCSPRHLIQSETAHQRVLDALRDFMTPQRIESLAAAAYRQHCTHKAPDICATLTAELATTERKLQNALNAILNGLYSPELQEVVEGLRAHKVELQQRIAAAAPLKETSPEQFRTALEKLTSQTPEELFRLFVPYVIRDGEELTVCIDLSGEAGCIPTDWGSFKVADVSTFATINNHLFILLTA